MNNPQEIIERQKQEIEELKRELRLTKLRRQVTPHFLFNSLSVSMSLITKDSKMAMKFLRHVAAMYCYLLSFGNEYHVPIELELKMLHQYYELMSIRSSIRALYIQTTLPHGTSIIS